MFPVESGSRLDGTAQSQSSTNSKVDANGVQFLFGAYGGRETRRFNESEHHQLVRSQEMPRRKETLECWEGYQALHFVFLEQ